VQTSLLQSQIFMLDFQAARWLVDGEVPGPAGNDHPTTLPMGCFDTADKPINVAPLPQHFETFCQLIERPDLYDDPNYATIRNRSDNREKLNQEVGQALASQNSEHWIELFNDVGIPCGPVNQIDEVFDDPQVKHLGMAATVASGALGNIDLVAQPMTLSRSQNSLVRATPERGENTDEILPELGYDRGRIAQLRNQDII